MIGRIWPLLVFCLLLPEPALGAKRRSATARPSPTTAAPPPRAEAAGGASKDVLLLSIDGGINPATADYIRDGIEAAQAESDEALVIQLDTPGGLLDSTKSIVKQILGAPLPVIVYVAPSGAGAASAGVFVTMAANVAAMAPGTNIGAAHPVGPQGESINGEMGKKVENFAASLSRTIAQQRGRNVEWAEKAVRESVSITEREAVKMNVVDLVADDVPDLLRKINGREVEVQGRQVVLATAGARVRRLDMRLRQKVLDTLANPNLAYLLMIAGILGLYVEFTHPGVLFPGVTGAICLLLALAAMQVLPINYTGLVLILLGVSLLVAELFLPSFGALGIGGMVAFVLGSLLLFDTPQSTVSVDRGIIAGAAVTLGGFTLLVGWLVVRTQRSRSRVGTEGMIGEIGEVRRALDPRGRVKVFVHGEYWDATADEPLDVGESVEVVGFEGMRMKVRRSPARPEPRRES
jgi:membrane-bound serine protease (ClpP class)